MRVCDLSTGAARLAAAFDQLKESMVASRAHWNDQARAQFEQTYLHGIPIELQQLFSAVQRLAVHELYVFVPELFELTKQHSDPVVFQAALNQEVVARLLFLARRLQAADDHAAALAVLSDALALDPANKELRSAQGTSQSAVKGAPAAAGAK